jgi:alpha-mannosidase
VNNCPEVGLDGKHQLIKLTPRILEGCVDSDGSAVFYLQAYTGNPMDVWDGMPLQERKPEVETVGEAALCLVDESILLLKDTLTFAHDLTKSLPETDHGRAIIAAEMERVVKDYRRGLSAEDLLARLRTTLGKLGGGPPHTVFPVGHAHLDSAWLWPVSITKLKMAHTTVNQLTLIDQYPEYVFAHSQPSQYVWLEEQHPELFRRVQEASKRGQWEVVGGMWVEADCNLSGAESLVRQFLYGTRYVEEKFQRQTEEVWLPDCFGFPASLPQIFRGFGLKHFVTSKLYWSEANKMPHHIYRWMGIDGSEVTAHHPPAECYTLTPLPKIFLESMANYKDPARCQGSLMLFGYGDGGGGPTREHLEYIRLATLTSSLPEVKERVSAADYFKFTEDNAKDLAVWDGELYLEYHRGTLTSQAFNKKSNRDAEAKLRDLEWIVSVASKKPDQALKQQIEGIWKRVLFNQFHDILPGTSIVEVYDQTKREYAEIDAELSQAIEEQLGNYSATEKGVVLFQNSTIPTQGEMEVSDDEAPGEIKIDGTVFPVQVVEMFGSRKAIFATPSQILQTPCTAELISAPERTSSNLRVSVQELSSERWAVKLDPQGHLVSIVDIASGIEFIDSQRPANVFELYDDVPNFWSAWNVDHHTLKDPEILSELDSIKVVETGPVRVAIEITRSFGQSKLVQRISLGPTPGVRFDTWVDWQESEKMLKVAFPVRVRSRHATYDIQFGSVERPTHRNTSWDDAMFEVCGHKWVDLSEAGQGVAILNDCKYGHDVHGDTLRMSLLRAPVAPDPSSDRGEHHFSYSIFPHSGDFREGGVVAAAYAFNSVTRTTKFKSPTPALIAQGLDLRDSNLVIETLKPSEDGDDLIVRLYECHGSRGKTHLRVPDWVRNAWICDLSERTIRTIEVENCEIVLFYEPFKLLTLKLSGEASD